MEKRRISPIEIILLIYSVAWLISGLIMLDEQKRFYEPFQQKLLIKGEVIDMTYYNMTFPNDINFNIDFDSISNITIYFYNLTINDYLSRSMMYCSLEEDIVEKFNVHIGSIIFIYRNAPFIEIK